MSKHHKQWKVSNLQTVSVIPKALKNAVNTKHDNNAYTNYELYWVNQFLKLQPLTFPYLSSEKFLNLPLKKNVLFEITLPPTLIQAVQTRYPNVDRQDILFTTLLIYFYRISNQTAFSIGFTYPELKKITNNNTALYADVLPFTIVLNPEDSFESALQKVVLNRLEVQENYTFAKELFARHSLNQDDFILPLTIEYTDGKSSLATHPNNDNFLNFLITNKGKIVVSNNLIVKPQLYEVLANIPKHLIRLLTDIEAQPNQGIATLALLSSDEETKILHEWNHTPSRSFAFKAISQLFYESVQKYPEKEAVKFDKQSLTYQTLNEKANQLAHYLRSIGVTKDTLVAICLERTNDLVVSLIAVLKSGAAYLPIDSRCPKDRLAYLFEDSKATVLITQESLISLMPVVQNLKQLCIDKEQDKLKRFSIENPECTIETDDRAYVIYTSGSTGQPKGVEITQGGLTNVILSAEENFEVQSSDRFLALTNIAFDIFAIEIYLPLVSGGTTVLAPQMLALDAFRLNHLLQKEAITFMQATPTVWGAFLNSVNGKKLNLKGICTGEALSSAIAQQLQNHLIKAWNLYGPTETTIWSMIQPLNSEPQSSSINSIGRPLANTEVYILDNNLQVVPIGVTGELYTGGLGLAKGYLGRMDLTQERFIANPFSANKNSRLYKTGDLCRYLPDGQIEYIGRADNQVKLRGFRIELGEIETQLRLHSEVKDCVVLVREDNLGEKKLIAYWIAKGNVVPTAEGFRDFLKSNLPDYMLPALYVELDYFPTTPNGKLDVKALPNPQSKQKVLPLTEGNSATLLEESIRKIWSGLLDLPPESIGAQDNFFVLGGDSILAMQVLSKIKNELDISFPIENFLSNPTISNLMSETLKLSNSEEEVTNPVLISKSFKQLCAEFKKQIKQSNIEEVYPLTPLQQGLLFQKWSDPNTNCYEIQIHWPIHQEINIDILKLSFQALINRHDILRSALIWEELKEPVQSITHQVAFDLEFLDWQHLNSMQQKKQLVEFLETNQENRAKLTVAPPFRVTLIKFSNKRYEMVWRLHHLLLDGWSMAILISELSEFYQHYTCNTELKLAPAYPFSEYVAWMHQMDWSEACSFWQNYLKDFNTPTNLPFINPIISSDKASLKHPFTALEIELSPEESNLIRQFSQSLGITLNTYFQGLWAILLHRYTQLDEIVFGVTTSGRHIPFKDIENRVGLFVNTVPLRVKFSEGLKPYEFFPQLQKEFIAMFPYSHTPLTHIQSHSELKNNHQSLFDSIVVFENYPQMISTSALEIQSENLHFWDPTHYALTFIVTPTQRIRLKIGYDARKIELESISSLLSHMRQLVGSTSDGLSTPVDKLYILPFKEYQTLLSKKGLQTEPELRTIVQLFEERAAKTPNALAIHDGEQHLSYGELNKISNQYAHYLKAMAVVPETPIGLCLPRSLNMIIGLLAIWKSGGAYVPLSPELPIARLHSITSMSQMKIILTERAIYEKVFEKHDEFSTLEFFFIEDYKNQLQNCIDENLVHQLQPNHLAYILFTSGSTGTPKGVKQEHKTLTNLAKWQAKSGIEKENCKISQLASISFDVSLQEISYALANGHELYIIPSTIKRSLSDLLQFLSNNEINQIFLPTALLEPFCEASLAIQPLLNSLTNIFISGEALKVSAVIKEFFASYPQVRLTNQYGPTETHVATAYRLPADSKTWTEFPCIGTPIDNMSLYVLDDKQQILPIGIPGELYIGGTGVARNYIGDAKLSANRFIVNPFSSDPNAKLYRTGDRAKWLSDGQLEYINRLDEQVKIRGHRVELKEIEMTLLKHPDVRQCMVLSNTHQKNSLQLVCYLITRNQEENTPALKAFLSETLPNYMIPTTFIYLKAFPVTLNGKIDKQALSKHNPIFISDFSCAPARNLFDEELIELWKQILNIENCSIKDDFFTLGGHSLSVLRLLLMIETKFNLKLTIDEFLLAPTIEKVSDKLMQRQTAEFLSPTEKILYENQELPWPIVLLKKGEEHPPLFLIHPVGGTLFWFVELARNLSSKRPVYGIQDPCITHDKPLFNSIEEMASFYLCCMKKIQPEGPYFIAGASFGATVAFEIAKQLEKTGESADFIGLLDGWARYPKEMQNKEKFEHWMRQENEQLSAGFQMHQLTDSRKWQDLILNRSELLWKYRFSTLQSKLTLFKAEELLSDFNWVDDPYNYWRHYSIKSNDVYRIPGNHKTMFKGINVKRLAKQIEACLEQCVKKCLKEVEIF